MKYFLPFLFLILSSGAHAQDTTRISVLFAGDVMGHDSQIASAYDQATNTYDYSSCLDPMRPYLESADIAIGNLEVTLAGPPYKGYPQFSSPDELAVSLKNVGFDVLVTANNHSVDRRKRGIERTIRVLDSLGIPHTGTFPDEVSRLNEYPLILQKNGFTLALLNYTYGTNGIPVPEPGMVNLIDTAQIANDLQKAKKIGPDVVIVFMHWGNEYQSLPSREQKQLAEFCFDRGADMVIGSHPHVLQPMEWRKEKDQFLVYSLGNFVSGQRKQYTDGGAMAYVELQKIRYATDSIVTSIDSAGYFLQWVYRTEDQKKDYYMVPVPHFEHDPAAFVKGAASIQAFRQFLTDSRQLYGKHNLNVGEIRHAPADSVVRYKIHLALSQSDTLKTGSAISPLSEYSFYGVATTLVDGKEALAIGDFRNQAAALRLCARLIETGRQATVVRYLNGNSVEPVVGDP